VSFVKVSELQKIPLVTKRACLVYLCK